MADPQITVLDQLDQLEEVVLDGSRSPVSGGRLVNETDAMEVIDALREAIPPQLALARDLLNQKDDFIGKARHQADDILQAAQREREQLINSAGIRQEAERQVNEMREQARQHCDQLLLQARAQAAQADQEQQMRLAQLEQQFAARRQQLEQEAAERQRLLVEQHDRNRQQAMAELEQIRQEGLRVQQASQAEAERLQNDALQFRQQTQQQCDALVARSRQEASSVVDGANRYAEQVLGELESRLRDLSQVVLGGRCELVRLQNPETTASANAGAPQDKASSRRARVASKLRQLAS
jgi:cell division septum initiation protein DivIVA